MIDVAGFRKLGPNTTWLDIDHYLYYALYVGIVCVVVFFTRFFADGRLVLSLKRIPKP